jgi:hypothetical protein
MQHTSCFLTGQRMQDLVQQLLGSAQPAEQSAQHRPTPNANSDTGQSFLSAIGNEAKPKSSDGDSHKHAGKEHTPRAAVEVTLPGAADHIGLSTWDKDYGIVHPTRAGRGMTDGDDGTSTWVKDYGVVHPSRARMMQEAMDDEDLDGDNHCVCLCFA